jgi:hypothetical protein
MSTADGRALLEALAHFAHIRSLSLAGCFTAGTVSFC